MSRYKHWFTALSPEMKSISSYEQAYVLNLDCTWWVQVPAESSGSHCTQWAYDQHSSAVRVLALAWPSPSLPPPFKKKKKKKKRNLPIKSCLVGGSNKYSVLKWKLLDFNYSSTLTAWGSSRSIGPNMQDSITSVTANSLKSQNGILFLHVWRRGRLALDPL